MTKHTLLRFFLCLFLLFAREAVAQPALTVYNAVEQLDNLLSRQTTPSLYLIPEAEDQTFNIYFINNRFGPGIEREKPTAKVKEINARSAPVFKLTEAGSYFISSTLGIGIEGLKLVWNSDTISLPSATDLILEISGLGLRYYPSGEEQRAAIRIQEEATTIIALLAISSGMVRDDKIPTGIREWIAIGQELEQNAFLQNQIGYLHLSLLPSDYPLLEPVVASLEQKARDFFRQFPSPSPMESAMKQSVIQQDYFNLQNIEKHYREPNLTDGTSELKSAEERIQRRRSEEGLNTTAIVTGLTDFVVERAKEEFSITFLERMQKDVATGGGNKIQELCLLFPQTCAFFSSQLDLGNYKSILPMAREVFIRDLRDVGLHIHQLLALDNYKNIENSGQIYNLALFYDIASMAYQGIALDTVLNNISVRLERREKDLFREQNREIAKKAPRPELQVLQSEVSVLAQQLDKLGKRIILKGIDLELAFDELKTEAEKTKENDLFQKIYKQYLQEISDRDEQLFLWTSREQYEQLLNIPRNLEGRRYFDRLMATPRLDQYNYYFSTYPDSLQLIASGIELSKKLVRTSKPTEHLPTFLTDYYRFLLAYEQKVKALTQQVKANTSEALQQRSNKLNHTIDTLRKVLDEEITFWTKLQISSLENDIFGLKYLQEALDSKKNPQWRIPSSLPANKLKETLQINEQYFQQALAWAADRMKMLQQKTNITSPQLLKVNILLSPIQPVSTLQGIETELLDSILTQNHQISKLLDNLDATWAPTIDTAYRQTLLMEQIAGMASILSSCLQISSQAAPGNPYLKPAEFYEIIRKNRSRDLFLGITQQQLQRLAPLSGPLSSKSVAGLTAKFVDIVYQAGVLRDSLDYAHSQNRKLRFIDYFPLVRSTMDLLSTIIDNRLNEEETKFNLLRHIPRITDQTLSMFENVQAERYGSALFNMVELFTLISQSNDSASRRWNAVRSDLIRYGSFMANVASATTADEVKGALLSVAQPPGSSRLKREDVFNVALNAYLGLSGGIETLNTPGSAKPRAASIGLGLPIGISTTWKFKRDSRMSYSALLSILDLGAVAAFRLGDNTAQDLPELKFENFVAPGGFLVANFPKSPFSLGLGAQYGPQARKVTFDGVESQSSAWRLMAFAAIDVPVFNFVSKKGRVAKLK